MTIVERSHKNSNFHITLEINERYGRSYYEVQVCPMIGKHLCGNPIRQTTYAMSEKSKAVRTYSRYVKKYL